MGDELMNTLKKAFLLNICIFVLEVFAITWIMTAAGNGVLSGGKLRALRYFTVDSNILMGLFSLWAAVDQGMVLKGKRPEVSTISYVLKLTGTVGVTLTMFVTIFFLGPTIGRRSGFFSLFAESNFFLHLVNPVLSIVTFLCFEKTNKIVFKHTFTAIIPLVIYAVYYVREVLTHMTDGVIQKGYDWYGFFAFGFKTANIILPLLLLVTWLISFVLWKLNRRK